MHFEFVFLFGVKRMELRNPVRIFDVGRIKTFRIILIFFKLDLHIAKFSFAFLLAAFTLKSFLIFHQIDMIDI